MLTWVRAPIEAPFSGLAYSSRSLHAVNSVLSTTIAPRALAQVSPVVMAEEEPGWAEAFTWIDVTAFEDEAPGLTWRTSPGRLPGWSAGMSAPPASGKKPIRGWYSKQGGLPPTGQSA